MTSFVPQFPGKAGQAPVVRDPTDLEIADYMAQAQAIGSGSFESSAPSAEEFQANLPQMQAQAVNAANNPGAAMSPSEQLNQLYGGASIDYGVPSLSAEMAQPRAPHFRGSGGGQMRGGGQRMQQQQQQQPQQPAGLNTSSLMELLRGMNLPQQDPAQWQMGGPMALPQHMQGTTNPILGRLLNG